jgi:hypothetical protein
MSRYVVHPEIKGKKYEVAYGFDMPLGEYFIQVFDHSIKDEDNQMIVWEGSYMTHKANSQMVHIMRHWGVPENHVECVMDDLIF